jgi:NADPH:quinone reductase-like Zn-dependent oxidoreductase
MKAMVLARFGGPDAFELRDVPVPAPGPRQVRVAVRATSVNPLDLQIRRGDYQDLVDLPAVIGHDVSGVVEAVGDGVTEFVPGDEVYYTPRIFGGPGSYAERHVADADLVARKPRNLTHAEAASLTLVGGTVWEALVTRARVEVGETVLVHGGAGGVGAVAVQLAHACGARVLTTCRAADADFVRGLGAAEAIDFEADDHLDAVLRLTDGRGADVVLDTVGGDTLTRAPRALAPLGRVVTLVDLATPQNLVEAWGKNATYHFVFTRQNRGKLDAFTALVERGLVRPVVGAVLPLGEIPRAHELLEGGLRRAGIRGKIAIEVAP